MKFVWLCLFFTFGVSFILPIKAYADFIDYPTVKLQALDKATARTITFEAEVGSTIEYGSVFIKVQACRKAEPLDTPENAAFLQIWEIPINSDKSEWIFSGWMFSSSPALSAMDHAVYDVWVLDCINKNEKVVATEEPQSEEENNDTESSSDTSQSDKAEDENVKEETSTEEDE